MPRKHVFSTVGLVVACLVLASTRSQAALSWYHKYIYNSWQYVRGGIFDVAGFSIGDVLYFLVCLLAAIMAIRGIFLLLTLPRRLHRFLRASHLLLRIVCIIYIALQVGWGLNYNKQPLAEKWTLPVDSVRLAEYDLHLIETLNNLAHSTYQGQISELNNALRQSYAIHVNTPINNHGISVKPSLFSRLLVSLGIEGYFNPFTGEAQISAGLPPFILPFVAAHEMAHQVGIASERDANLLAYVVCSSTDGVGARYAASFSVWQMVHRRLAHRNLPLARQYEQLLNPLSRRHIVTMDSLSQLYDNAASDISSELYDDYLKLQSQKKGLRSYGDLVTDSWRYNSKATLRTHQLDIY